jgi:hypothetical protein
MIIIIYKNFLLLLKISQEARLKGSSSTIASGGSDGHIRGQGRSEENGGCDK